MPEDKLFFVGQKAFIEKNGEVLILITPVGLDFPGGKVQEGEKDFVESLKREVREETGLEIEVGSPFATWLFEYPADHKKRPGQQIYLVGYKCKYLSGEVQLSEEHEEYQWVNKDNFTQMNRNPAAYFETLERYFKILN
ncbi:MAG: NUDIX domain-containing protein [Candidatus Doudnabacteria bacterium]